MPKLPFFGAALSFALFATGCLVTDEPWPGYPEESDGTDAGVEAAGGKLQAIINGTRLTSNVIFPRVDDNCSGMLLTNRWAVTATHCLDKGFYLDRSFAGDGQSWLPISLSALGNAQDSVGRRLALTINWATSRYELWRFRMDGSRDTSFNAGAGMLTMPAGFGPMALAVDSADRTILAGGRNSKIAAMRVRADGTVDSSFGSAGVADVDFSSRPYEYAQSVLVMPDGAIFLGGFAQDNARVRQFAIAKLSATNGALDTTFGGDGKLLPNIGTTSEAITDLTVMNGKLLASGPGITDTGRTAAVVARFIATGNSPLENADATFGLLGASWFGWYDSGFDTTPTNAVILSGGSIGLGFNLTYGSGSMAGLFLVNADGFAQGTGGTTGQGFSWFEDEHHEETRSRTLARVARDPSSNLVIGIGNLVSEQGFISVLSGTGGTDYTGIMSWSILGGSDNWIPSAITVSGGKTTVMGTSLVGGVVNVNSLFVIRSYNFGQTTLQDSAGLDMELSLNGETREVTRIVRVKGQDSALVQVNSGFPVLGVTSGWSVPDTAFVDDWASQNLPQNLVCYGWGANAWPNQGAGTLRSGAMTAVSVGSQNISLSPTSAGQLVGPGDSGGACITSDGTKYAGTISRGSETGSLIARSEKVHTAFKSSVVSWGP